MYDEKFELLSSMQWDQGPALAMVFNPVRDEAICAGKAGETSPATSSTRI